jgi:hypothetical protein
VGNRASFAVANTYGVLTSGEKYFKYLHGDNGSKLAQLPLI